MPARGDTACALWRHRWVSLAAVRDSAALTKLLDSRPTYTGFAQAATGWRKSSDGIARLRPAVVSALRIAFILRTQRHVRPSDAQLVQGAIDYSSC